MSDLIDRQVAIDAVKELCLHYTSTESVRHPHIDFVVEELERLPSAQPQRKTARWEILYPNHTYKYHCSECGANHKYMFDFCPSCGARMED